MQGGETGEGLEYAEDEIDDVHCVQREDTELDGYPQHQRNAKDSAKHQSPTIMAEYQHRGGKVGQSVHAQQCHAAPHEVLKKDVGKRQYLKAWQHVRHVPYLTMRVHPKQDSTAYRADTDKNTPEKQCPTGNVEFSFCFHIVTFYSPLMTVNKPLKH